MPTLNRRNTAVVALLILAVGIAAASTGITPISNNDSGTVLKAGNGPAVTLTGDTDVYTTSGGTAGENGVRWNTTAGNATFIANGTANATVHKDDLTGTWTTATELDVATNDLYINPEDKHAINVSGDLTWIEFRDAALDDGQADFIYAGSTGSTTVTIRGLPADTWVTARDQATDETLDVSQTDANGVVTLNDMPNSEHTVQLIQDSGNNPVLTDPQPDGNVSTPPDEFSVHVADDDFPGDNVTVEFYYEGSQIDTAYTETDSRVNTTNVPSISAGVNDWSAVATDENGNQDVMNATVGQPGTLYIRNETNPSELVDSPVNVTVGFENGTVIEERTTSDGTIDMEGLPTTDFIVSIDASENYYPRTVYFETIIGDNSVYLLNETYRATNARFVLDDPTGQFPSSSVIYVQKAINRSGENKYRTIHSDRFGVEGVTTDLQEGERYQIVIRSPDGTVQEIGPYRADVDETVTVRPGTPTIELGEYEDGWASNAELNNRTLEARYSDPENDTQQVTLFIHEKGNTGNRLRPNTTYYDLGSFDAIYQLDENESKKTWVVNFVVDRNNEELVVREEVANNPSLVPDLSREWRLITGIGMLLISAGMFSLLNAGVGAVIVGVQGGLLWWTGWLEGATMGAAVVIAIFVAVIIHLYQSSGP